MLFVWVLGPRIRETDTRIRGRTVSFISVGGKMRYDHLPKQQILSTELMKFTQRDRTIVGV